MKILGRKKEIESILRNDDDQTTNIDHQKRKMSKQQSTHTSKYLQLGIGILLLIFLSIIIAVAILKIIPARQKSHDTIEMKQDIEKMTFKAIFSTSYIFDNENQSPIIKNLDIITNTLNKKLNENKIRVLSGFFQNNIQSKEILCDDPLNGNILQLTIAVLYADECVSQDDDTCKIQVKEQLKITFAQMTIIPVNIQLANDQFENIYIKICHILDISDEQKDETVIAASRKRKIRKATASVAIAPKRMRILASNHDTPYTPIKRSRCALCLNKIGLVQMDGDYGTNIHDDIRTYTNSQSSTMTLYEETTHKLHVQLDCGGYLDGDSTSDPCSDSLSVHIWVDYNDNRFDDGESQILHRSWPNNGASTGIYDLQIYIPAIDDRNTRAGLHTMRLTVMPSEQYQRDCGTMDYKETRDYTVNIIPKARYEIITTTPYMYRNSLCSIQFGRIILVIMAGEVGTEIRDDKVYNALTNINQNQHHMAVTLYEHTVYLLRIQLDCSSQLKTELTDTGCNLAQDVNVWIDWNDDGNFDTSEIGAPHRWPVTSYMPQGVYDIQLSIPLIDERYIANRSHRMRIMVTPNEQYQRTCGSTEYSETREYYVNIISRSSYLPAPDASNSYLAPENITCSPQVGKIIFAIMAGEHRTQIRDDFSTRTLLGNKENQQHLSIILRQGITYLLRLQFECDENLNRDSSYNNCNLPHDINVWIDLNDDGQFSESERVTPYRWPLTSYLPQGIYDLQVRVPLIDGRKRKSGPHRMQLVIALNKQYRRKCAYRDYNEIRNYTVRIVSDTIKSVDIGGPYLTLSDAVCRQTNARIVLVIMAGEQGTQIRDDTHNNTVIREYQNRHHMAVSVYENTYYRIRIQLDCDPASSRGPLNDYCNLAQDVNVLIDLNDDGRYDQSESFIQHRWPLRSSSPLGLYDHKIHIPAVNELHRRTGTYRMRIIVKPSEEYNEKCGHTDYAEIRDYTLQIIPRQVY